ncbi:MAG: 16S rRNA (cytosine(1402)-N(4))-methyltransferase RsmH [Acidimicrobiales bacterium]
MAYEYSHRPVLLDEVVDLFTAAPPGVVVDGTVGGGGHAGAVLDACPLLGVLGLDRDPEAVRAASARLGVYGSRAVVQRAAFANLAVEVETAFRSGAGHWPSSGSPRSGTGPSPSDRPVLSGVLLDLGVSSPQLDRPERGFSYRGDGPLDMRMDPESGPGAAELVNGASVDELSDLFGANGEGRFARRIARAVVAARPVATTAELADVVARAVPAAGRRRGHPARRVFQALRIAVNDEVEQLATVLPDALALLAPGGRLVVLSYHSGEDRVVKGALSQAASGGCVCPPGLPCVCGAEVRYRLVFRGSHQPSEEEVRGNPRAKSARLRAVERLGDVP